MTRWTRRFAALFAGLVMMAAEASAQDTVASYQKCVSEFGPILSGYVREGWSYKYTPFKPCGPDRGTGVVLEVCTPWEPHGCMALGSCGYCPEGDDFEGAVVSAPPRTENGPTSCGSEIDDFSLTLGERIAISGTPYALVYQSDRGRRLFEYQAKMRGARPLP